LVKKNYTANHTRDRHGRPEHQQSGRRHGGGNHGRNNQAAGNDYGRNSHRRATHQARPEKSERTPPARLRTSRRALDAFELFCAYYLGITPDNRYQKLRLDEVAIIYRLTPAKVQALMERFGLTPPLIAASGFDLEMAQYDIKVAPEGISLRELAKPWFEELQEALEALPQNRRRVERRRTEVRIEPREIKSLIFED